MKAVPFDAFGSAQAASYCADVADRASWPLALCCPRRSGMQSSRQPVMLTFLTKRSATLLHHTFRERVQRLLANHV